MSSMYSSQFKPDNTNASMSQAVLMILQTGLFLRDFFLRDFSLI